MTVTEDSVRDLLYALDPIAVETVDADESADVKRGTLIAPNGQEIPLAPGVYEVLTQVLHQIEAGKAVQVVAYGKDLTTQQAADILNISRQYLVRLVDRGEIPHTMVGTHRRLHIEDVLEYRQRRRADRRDALRELTQASQEMGDY